MNIGNKIKTLRNEKKLTQKQLATLLDTSASAIGMYEQNRREPDNSTIIKIANYFQISTDYLFGLSDIRFRSVALKYSEQEQSVIEAYRSHPEMRSAVNRLLGIEEKKSQAKIAARDGSQMNTELTEEEIRDFKKKRSKK